MNRFEKLFAIGFIIFIAFIIGIAIFGFSMVCSGMNAETMVVDVSESDILWDEEDFYIIDPDGVRIPLGIDGNEILDLTKHSRILVKFKRYPAYGLYGGTDWFVDGVVKTPNPLDGV